MDEQCAYALLWGMPYDLFWHGEFDAFRHYMKKAQLEEEKRLDFMDSACWLAGCYTKMALESVYHLFNAWAGRKAQKGKYPKEPMRMTEKKNKSQEAKNLAIYKRLKSRFGGRKGKVGDGGVGNNDRQTSN